MGAFTHTGTALEWRGAHETVRIEPWDRNSLRVRGTVWQAIRDDLPGALLEPPAADGADVDASVDVSAGIARISNGCLTAEVSGSGQLRFLRADGRELLSEITAPAPLDTIPVYLRAGGSVKPFGPLGNLGPENSGG